MNKESILESERANGSSRVPRIDEVEAAIDTAQEKGIFSKELTTNLIKELHQADLLTTLIRKRLEHLVKGLINSSENDASEINRKEPDEDAYPDTLCKLSEAWFGDQVDRRYLERRDSLERVSFRMLRTTSKGIALEAHQRLLNQEESWQQISDRWGQDPERKFQGRYAPISPAKLQIELSRTLRRLQPGELTEPMRLGKQFVLLELIQWYDVELSKELRIELEREMMNEWIQSKVNKIQSDLEK